MSGTTIALLILVVLGILVVGVLLSNANRRRGRADVPPAMAPAYSDEQLERGVLERNMTWGLVLTVGLAVFFPVYWLTESSRLTSERTDFFVESVVRGEVEYEEQCSECHAPNLAGGAASSPYSEASWPAPALDNIALRYADTPNVPDIYDFIVTTLEQGRPGTPMPTWGAAYGGPLTDQQIADITNYILANQIQETEQASNAADMTGEELYTENCVKCHGENLAGLGPDGVPRPGPSLIGVLERHSRDDILAILNNGLYIPTGTVMPGFGEVLYQYEGARYTTDALERIVDYLEESQPADLPEDARAVADARGRRRHRRHRRLRLHRAERGGWRRGRQRRAG